MTEQVNATQERIQKSDRRLFIISQSSNFIESAQCFTGNRGEFTQAAIIFAQFALAQISRYQFFNRLVRWLPGANCCRQANFLPAHFAQIHRGKRFCACR
jgi:hypothetical protein